MEKSVYLSPSTQENNHYTDGATEETEMNSLCDIVEPYLKKHGVKTYRNKPTMNLNQVANDSNAKKPGIHFALHSNARGSSKGVARGCSIYIHTKTCPDSYKLAASVYKQVSEVTPTADRGIMESKDHFGPGKPLYELAYTNAPGALLEAFFHDNSDDVKWYRLKKTVLAHAVGNGILNFFDIPIQPQTAEDIATEMLKAGLITDKPYWVSVLSGTQIPNFEYLKITYLRALQKINKTAI